MVTIAIVLAAVTIGGHMTPWLLLALTFALSAGDAFETPTWRAILPELVGPADLAAASARVCSEMSRMPTAISRPFSSARGPSICGSTTGPHVRIARWKNGYGAAHGRRLPFGI